jgi:hypothetical protein
MLNGIEMRYEIGCIITLSISGNSDRGTKGRRVSQSTSFRYPSFKIDGQQERLLEKVVQTTFLQFLDSLERK